MTNEERKEMYQDWENLLGTHLYSADHDERIGMLESLLKGIGRRLDYDMTSLLLLINEYDKEACKPDVEPKMGGIYRVTHDVYFGDEVCLWKGDIVKIISDFRKLSYEVQSLMPIKYDNGKWWLTLGCLEEV
jgi:hypothetical protein